MSPDAALQERGVGVVPSTGVSRHDETREISRSLFDEVQGEVLTGVAENGFDNAVRSYLSFRPEQAFCFLDEGALSERARLFQRAFMPDHRNAEVAYAVKANPREQVLRLLTAAGLGAFDCASWNEIAGVRDVSEGARILFNHPIKKRRDIERATASGVRHFTVQTQDEIEKVLAHSSRYCDTDELEVAVRLRTFNPKAGINLSEKYGAEAAEVVQMLRFLRDQTGVALGLSVHTGSQNGDVSVFTRAIRLMADIAAEVGSIRTLNVGGGLPVNYHEHERYDLGQFLGVISGVVQTQIDRTLGEDVCVLMEPGRAMVAESVGLFVPILAVEDRGGQKCLYIDDGLFTSFSDYSIHDWKYPFRPFSLDADREWGKKSPYVVFGRTCDSGDCLGTVLLPENLQEGDYLNIPNAGAYMDVQSTRFNGFDPPRYVSYNTVS